MAKAKEKVEPQEQEVMVPEPTEGSFISLEESDDLYQTDPELVDDDIIINTTDRPIILPRGTDRNSSIRLEKGDRIKGVYYRKLVTEHKIPGLQLCCKMKKDNLLELERIRKLRTGDEYSELVKEIHARKNEESTREALRAGGVRSRR